VTLVPRRTQVDLGGKIVTAMTYGGALPGALVRVGAGDVLRATVRNELDGPTSVHWHGLALRNDTDGVPEVTGGEVAAGATSSVEVVVPDDPGTYWFHPHTGLQLDWGLYAPLVVEDPHEPGGYDHELVVVLDDWTVGIGRTPEQLLADLQAGKGMTGMGHLGGTAGMGDTGDMGGMSGMDMGGAGGMGSMSDTGDVEYPAYLANGRLASDPTSLAATPGQRVRIRFVNAAADTIFDVALTDHQLTVTHSDGFPVVPVQAEVLRIAMGERYDAVVTLADGVFPLVAAPVGKSGTAARVIVRTGAGQVPGGDARPAELNGQILTVDQLVAADAVRLTDREPETVQQVLLGGTMGDYRWTINGTDYDHTVPLTVRQGQLTRLHIENRTMMVHPMHLHGHTFAVRNGGDARKDTVLVPAMRALADNPGRWMMHCHNAFHMGAGMMTRLDYTA
jgi:FtsP/CotA-like multicopper oxidase with cupredoxin domain